MHKKFGRVLTIITVILLFVAVIFSVTAAGMWRVPLTVDVGFEYTGGQTSSLTLHFDSNSQEEGYASLTQPSVQLEGEQIAGYVPLSAAFTVNDSDPNLKYYFGGWSTLPDGGVIIDENNTVASVSDGLSELTLYAVWLEKAEVSVTLQDTNYISYDISFNLAINEESAISYQTTGQQTLTFSCFLAPDNIWSMNFAAGTRTSVIDSQSAQLESGAKYSVTATVTIVVVLPTELTKA